MSRGGARARTVTKCAACNCGSGDPQGFAAAHFRWASCSGFSVSFASCVGCGSGGVGGKVRGWLALSYSVPGLRDLLVRAICSENIDAHSL